MKFSVDPKIFAKFPGVEIGVLVITGMDNSGHNKDILQLLRSEEKHQKEILTGVELGSLPEVAVWRKIYTDFGSGKDYRSSVEALLRRARGGKKPLPQINNLVDLYNFLSLKYHLPAGAEDLKKIVGDTELTFADGSEKGKYIGGEAEDTCYQGEVIYRDKVGFICRRWNWREADRTKIEFDTENCIMVIEKAPEVGEENFHASLKEASSLIQKYLSGKVQTFILNQSVNSFEIPFKTGGKSAASTPTKPVKPIRPTQESPYPVASLFQEDGNVLSYKIRQIILQACREVITEKEKIELKDVKLEHPREESYGDYSTNCAMILATRCRMKPQELAKRIEAKLNKYIIQHQTITFPTDSNKSSGEEEGVSSNETPPQTQTVTLSDMISKVEVAGSGFINLWLQTDYLITKLAEVLKEEDGVKSTQNMQKKRVVIEHTQPNTNKPMHIGHIRNSVLGMALVHIFKELGWQVLSTNINNDRGVHICKSMWGYLFFGQKAKKSSKFKAGAPRASSEWKKYGWRDLLDRWSRLPQEWQNPTDAGIKPDHFVGDFYVKAAKLEADYPKVNKDITEMLVAWENDDSNVHKLWETMNNWFYEGRNMTLKRLGVVLDTETYESKLYKKGKEIILDSVQKGIFTRLADGAIQANLEKYGLPNKVLIRKDGTAIYMTFDIELTRLRLFDKGYDLGIWVVGSDQILHFRQLFAICEMLGFMKREQGYHLPYGMVYLSGGEKMSSREGNVVYADEVIDKMVILAREKAKSAKLQVKGTELAEIAEKVGIGALIYSMLKVSPLMDVNFDTGKSVSFEGDSGPYLQYTYARCRSVVRKWEMGNGKLDRDVGNKSKDLTSHLENLASHISLLTSNLNPEELALLRTFYRFPEAVTEAAKTFSPNLICSFLFDLAQRYNLFYNKHSILNPTVRHSGKSLGDPGTHPESVRDPGQARMTSDFRLLLTSATAQIIEQGLYLLGIETVERM